MGDSTNPNDPSYEPPSAKSGGPNVGHGDTFGADLYYLYRAGRVYFPQMAQKFSQTASAQAGLNMTLSGQVDAAGSPTAMTTMMTLANTLQDAISKSCTTLRDCGTGLVTIANNYAETDAAASAAFRRLYDENHAQFTMPTPAIPTPPLSTDPPPAQPRSTHRMQAI